MTFKKSLHSLANPDNGLQCILDGKWEITKITPLDAEQIHSIPMMMRWHT